MLYFFFCIEEFRTQGKIVVCSACFCFCVFHFILHFFCRRLITIIFGELKHKAFNETNVLTKKRTYIQQWKSKIALNYFNFFLGSQQFYAKKEIQHKWIFFHCLKITDVLRSLNLVKFVHVFLLNFLWLLNTINVLRTRTENSSDTSK